MLSGYMSHEALLQLVVSGVDGYLVCADIALVGIPGGCAGATLTSGPSVPRSCGDWQYITGVHHGPDGRNELGGVGISGVLGIPPARLAAPAGAAFQVHAPLLDRKKKDVVTGRADSKRRYVVSEMLIGGEVV